MGKILVCDTIAREGMDILQASGAVEVRTGLSEDELVVVVEDALAIVVRSATQITSCVIEAAKACQIIARAGVGVDNVDVPAATRKGILVVNSPAGNILAAAEHSIALLLAAARQIPQADHSIKMGEWDRKRFWGKQIEGKTLGLIGLGSVGTAVARRAQGLGLRVVAHDPHVTRERAAACGVTLVELEELLRTSDFVSLHAVVTAVNQHLIGAHELSLLKPGALLVNTARGALVDEAALVSALREGPLMGAALDVFEEEPTHNEALLALPNVILTPHVGALTEEAQVNVAVDAARQVVDVLSGLPPRWPVNAPALSPEALSVVAPLIPLARAMGHLGRVLLGGPLGSFHISCSESPLSDNLDYLTAVILSALLDGTTSAAANIVNARLLAEERHIEIQQQTCEGDRGYTNYIELRLFGDIEITVAGALLDRERPRLVNLNGYDLDLPPVGHVVLIWRAGHGRPGFIGRVGSLLGEAGVSISFIQVSQRSGDDVGLLTLAVADDVPLFLVEQLRQEDGVVACHVLNLGA